MATVYKTAHWLVIFCVHRYQQEIYECSECSHPINDGSERLWTRSHDAPRGEFRQEQGASQWPQPHDSEAVHVFALHRSSMHTNHHANEVHLPPTLSTCLRTRSGTHARSVTSICVRAAGTSCMRARSGTPKGMPSRRASQRSHATELCRMWVIWLDLSVPSS